MEYYKEVVERVVICGVKVDCYFEDGVLVEAVEVGHRRRKIGMRFLKDRKSRNDNFIWGETRRW
jgi:hypothetical protein